jgi:CRISPR-associated protein Cas5/CasD subtype I-E
MSVLVIRLTGPMQSWGGRSRFNDRDTQAEPTKSAICGLLGCALGRERGSDFSDLAALRLAIRVDAQGTLAGDFHTAGAAYDASRMMTKADSSGKHTTATIGTRSYLQDAMFTIALAGDQALLEHLALAIDAPHWPLSLGRRAFAPTDPVLLGVLDGNDPVAALCTEVPRFFEKDLYRIVSDDDAGEFHQVPDMPRSALDRGYATRRIANRTLACTAPIADDGYAARAMLALSKVGS